MRSAGSGDFLNKACLLHIGLFATLLSAGTLQTQLQDASVTSVLELVDVGCFLHASLAFWSFRKFPSVFASARVEGNVQNEPSICFCPKTIAPDFRKAGKDQGS